MVNLSYANAEDWFKWHYRLVWFLGGISLFDGLPAMLATHFALAGPAYTIQIFSALALIVLGFVIRQRSLIAMWASLWIVVINSIIGLHLSYQNFGLGIVTVGNAVWAIGLVWVLSIGPAALKVLTEEAPDASVEPVGEDPQDVLSEQR